MAQLYYNQNTAFGLCGDLSQRDYYHGVEELDLNEVYIELYTYNCTRTKYQLTMDEILDYLGSEYDSDGRPRIYSQPENIKDYIGWEKYI